MNGHTDITVEPLVEAQAPIESIIHKTEKALSNQKKTSPVIKRMTLLLAAMTAVQTAIINQLSAKKDPSLIWGLFVCHQIGIILI